jgi:hypothetical protein
MYVDGPRNRILFVLDAMDASAHVVSNDATGLWEYDVLGQTFTKRFSATYDSWIGPGGRNAITINNLRASAVYDLVQNAASLSWCASTRLGAWGLHPKEETLVVPFDPIITGRGQPSSAYPGDWELGRSTFVAGWLWFPQPFCRLSQKGEMQFYADKAFGPIVSVDVIDEGKHLLLCSKHGLWLLDM